MNSTVLNDATILYGIAVATFAASVTAALETYNLGLISAEDFALRVQHHTEELAKHSPDRSGQD